MNPDWRDHPRLIVAHDHAGNLLKRLADQWFLVAHVMLVKRRMRRVLALPVGRLVDVLNHVIE